MDIQLAFNPLSAEIFRNKLRDAETRLNGHMPLFVFNNHDNPRSWTRYADGKNDLAIAKLLATVLLTPRCAAILYCGEEIGMENNDPKRKEDVQDPIEKIGWSKEKGRDGERTPMQWDASPNAGFSTGKTWLPVAPSHATRNVAAESKDPDSLLSYYKALLRLRKTNAALNSGDFSFLNEADRNVLAFARTTNSGTAVVVAMNFTGMPRMVSLTVPAREWRALTVLSSFSRPGVTVDLKNLELRAYGSLIEQLK